MKGESGRSNWKEKRTKGGNKGFGEDGLPTLEGVITTKEKEWRDAFWGRSIDIDARIHNLKKRKRRQD